MADNKAFFPSRVEIPTDDTRKVLIRSKTVTDSKSNIFGPLEIIHSFRTIVTDGRCNVIRLSSVCYGFRNMPLTTRLKLQGVGTCD